MKCLNLSIFYMMIFMVSGTTEFYRYPLKFANLLGNNPLIMFGGYRKKRLVSLAVYATIALVLMLAGAIGTGVATNEYFGIFQRFSNLISANGFLAVLGMYLFMGKFSE